MIIKTKLSSSAESYLLAALHKVARGGGGEDLNPDGLDVPK